jgi:hypothetical protein
VFTPETSWKRKKRERKREKGDNSALLASHGAKTESEKVRVRGTILRCVIVSLLLGIG